MWEGDYSSLPYKGEQVTKKSNSGLRWKIVHFVIKALNLVQLRPQAVWKKLDIGPSWIFNMVTVVAILKMAIDNSIKLKLA